MPFKEALSCKKRPKNETACDWITKVKKNSNIYWKSRFFIKRVHLELVIGRAVGVVGDQVIGGDEAVGRDDGIGGGQNISARHALSGQHPRSV